MKICKLLLVAALGLMMTVCANDDEQAFTTELPIEFNIFDGGVAPSSRATTDLNYITQFVDGDQIGLYAVKEGAIVRGIENLPLTYASGRWSAAEPLMYSDELVGATFYAYYPYAAESLFDATAADPFAAKLAAWTVAEDISSEELFAANDLMTGSAEALLSEGRYTMTLGLKHLLSMIVVELPSTKYTFTNTTPTLSDYTVAAANPTFTVVTGDVEQTVKPLYVAEKSNYRLLVKAATPCSMVGRFEVGGKPHKYTIPFAEGIAAGTYEPFVVDGGVSEKSMELKVGDYFCADGSIASYEAGATAPANAVGVVYQLGTTDGIKAAKPACTHAMVYALTRAARGTAEGVEDPNDYKDDAYLTVWSTQSASGTNRDTWAIDRGMAGADGKLNSSDDKSVTNGYELTTIWLNLPLIEEKDLVQLLRATHAAATPVPTNTTGWFVPSILETQNLNGMADVLNPVLTAAGGEALWTGCDTEVNAADSKFIGYWTSTLRRGDAVLGYKPDAEKEIVAYTSTRKGYFRFALAF